MMKLLEILFYMNDCSCFYMMLNDNTSEEYL